MLICLFYKKGPPEDQPQLGIEILNWLATKFRDESLRIRLGLSKHTNRKFYIVSWPISFKLNFKFKAIYKVQFWLLRADLLLKYLCHNTFIWLRSIRFISDCRKSYKGHYFSCLSFMNYDTILNTTEVATQILSLLLDFNMNSS